MHINSSAPKKKKKNFYIDSTKEMPSKNKIGSCFEKPWCFKSTTLLFSSQKKKLFCSVGSSKKKDSSVQWALQGRIPISSNTNFVHLKTNKKSLTLNNNLNLLSLSSGHCYRCHSLRSNLDRPIKSTDMNQPAGFQTSLPSSY